MSSNQERPTQGSREELLQHIVREAFLPGLREANPEHAPDGSKDFRNYKLRVLKIVGRAIAPEYYGHEKELKKYGIHDEVDFCEAVAEEYEKMVKRGDIRFVPSVRQTQAGVEPEDMGEFLKKAADEIDKWRGNPKELQEFWENTVETWAEKIAPGSSAVLGRSVKEAAEHLYPFFQGETKDEGDREARLRDLKREMWSMLYRAVVEDTGPLKKHIAKVLHWHHLRDKELPKAGYHRPGGKRVRVQAESEVLPDGELGSIANGVQEAEAEQGKEKIEDEIVRRLKARFEPSSTEYRTIEILLAHEDITQRELGERLNLPRSTARDVLKRIKPAAEAVFRELGIRPPQES